MKKNSSNLLTEGPIGKKLILFALPFFGSSLIQQLYNTVDLIFVGRLLGTEASAAVGASSLLITLLLGFFTGMSVGIGVVTAQAFGAGDRKRLHDIIHTAAGISLVTAAVLIVAGVIFSPTLLRMMKTPEEILGIATTYIRIYFVSMFSVVCFNITSGMIRALGNSRSPMIYQLFGGIANIFGNAFFLIVLKMGVSGVAFASLLSQTVASFLTIRHLFLLPREYRLNLKEIRINPTLCCEILKVGIPAAIQSMVITFSNLIVQSQINSLGTVNIAAFTAYFKVETFIYLPILAIGQANTTFCGQNIGAGKQKRALQGTAFSILVGSIVTILISTLLLVGGNYAFGMFSKDISVIEIGRQISMTTFPFYFLYVFLECFSGAIRGAGYAVYPMIIALINMCPVRLICLAAMMRKFHSAPGVAKIYPITWATTVVCLGIAYNLINRKTAGKQVG